MPLTGDALKIRGFNFDPWSQSGDHFTAMYAMTDDGFYRCTGLPSAASWTQKLSKAQAAALIGQAEADTHLIWSFTPSVKLAGFVWCGAGIEYSSGGGGTSIKLHALQSLDYGANWTCDTSKYLLIRGTNWNSIALSASYHLANTYYVNSFANGGWIMGNEGYSPNWWDQGVKAQTIAKSTAFPAFDLSLGANFTGVGGADPYVYVPLWADNVGTPYTDDSTGLLLGQAGIPLRVAKSTSLFTVTPPGNTPRTDKGEGTMGAVLATANMFNSDCIWAWSGTTLWRTTNGGTSWQSGTVTLGGVNVTITSVYSVPADTNVVLLCGTLASGGISAVGLSINGGATFTSIALTGDPGGIDSVLSLAAGDTERSQIALDYYKA